MGILAFIHGITVEPTVFLNTLGVAFSFLSVQNLIVQKTCSPNVEPPISFICNSSLHVLEAADITFARSTLKAVLSAISIPILAAWRDATGSNRFFISLPQLAEIIITFMYLFSTWNWSISPWVASINDAIIGGLFGENILYLTSTCVITENSTPEDRTRRLQFYVTSMFIGGALGAALNGFILTPLGYNWFFTLVIVLYMTALILAIIFVKDSKYDTEEKRKWIIVDKMKYVFKKRTNNSVIWIMLICSSLVGTYSSAETNLQLYYLQQGFQFSIMETGLYGAYRVVVGVLGTVLIYPIFTKVFEWSDFKIGIACSLLTIISAVSMTLAKTRVELYLLALLDILKFVLYSLPKSVISKCVENDELGSFLSFGSIVGICLPFVINTFYNQMFAATSDTMPGAFFIISAAGHFIVLLSFSVSSCLYRCPKDLYVEKCENKTMDIGNWKNLSPDNDLVLKN